MRRTEELSRGEERWRPGQWREGRVKKCRGEESGESLEVQRRGMRKEELSRGGGEKDTKQSREERLKKFSA